MSINPCWRNTGSANGYIMLEWLGESRNFSRLYLTVAEQGDNEDHTQQVVDVVQRRSEKGATPPTGRLSPNRENMNTLFIKSFGISASGTKCGKQIGHTETPWSCHTSCPAGNTE